MAAGGFQPDRHSDGQDGFGRRTNCTEARGQARRAASSVRSTRLEAIAQRIRTARADLADPRRPQGVFLLVGPSGVGKTETAMALADLLYGGDRNMVIVNTSEYRGIAQSLASGRHVERLRRLRRRRRANQRREELGRTRWCCSTKSKSAPESVQEIFYQAFDKGVLQNDGEDVNFKNTIILLTSNVGTDTIMKACADPDTTPTAEGLTEMLKADLLKAFKPAAARPHDGSAVLPAWRRGALKKIIELKLKQIAERLKANYKATFAYSPAVVDTIAACCKDVDTGARNADHIITGTVLVVMISAEVLARMAENKPVKAVSVDVDSKSQFVVTVE